MTRLLRRAEIEQRVGLSRSSLYRLMRSGQFPKPVQIGERAVRWLESEINDWLASCPRAKGDAFAAKFDVEDVLADFGYQAHDDGSGLVVYRNGNPKQTLDLDYWERRIAWVDLEDALDRAGISVEAFKKLLRPLPR